MRTVLFCLILLCFGWMAGCVRAPALPSPPGPAGPPEGLLFHNTAFGWSARPPAGWRATATGGNADPGTAPAVTFVPPGAGRSQDEFLAVRSCRSVEECLPPGAVPAGSRPAGGSSPLAYVTERQVAQGRRLREVHTFRSRVGQLFDLVLSRPVEGAQEAETLYPAFRDSFQFDQARTMVPPPSTHSPS